MSTSTSIPSTSRQVSYSSSRQAAALLGFVVLCLAAGGLGAVATTPEIAGWYQTLAKPTWNPPAAVFGPVWTTLYICMAVAAWLVWRRGGPLVHFFVQLALNVAWSWIFFGLHQPAWALAEIVVLWVMIAVTTAVFFRYSKVAAGLLAPYLAWVTFATVLNAAIAWLN